MSNRRDASQPASALSAPKRRRHESEETLRRHNLQRATGRAIRAARPRPGEEGMRVAYLELLKLCLCDLAGARTMSVSRSGDSRQASNSVVTSRELDEDELRLRVMGADWPLSGLTMIGLEKLDDLQACIESVVADGVEGDVIEAGVWRGGASLLARATLDSLGADDRTVWLADSFGGLPSPDAESFPQDVDLDLSQVDFLAAPLEEVRGYFERFGCEHGVEFVPGLFNETLPTLRDRCWSVVRLDGDTYEATWLGLESLYPGLSVGGYLIIDDFGLIKECRAAVRDFRRAHKIREPIEKIDWNGVRWRRERKPAATAPAPPPPTPRRPAQTVAREPATHIPTDRELELEQEVVRLRAQIESRRQGRGRAPR